MADKKPSFAVDLAPEGVNLWYRGRFGDWIGLGFVTHTADNFLHAIEKLRREAAHQGKNSAEIRIAKSDVYFTRIKAESVPDVLSDEAILELIADGIPFRDKQDRLILDTCRRGSGDLAVAVVAAKTLEAAADFATRHGFEPSYFTTLNNPMIFPAEPRFRLVAPPKPMQTLTPHRNRGRALAVAAGVALCVLGLVLVRGVVVSAPDTAAAMATSDSTAAGRYPAPVTIELAALPLPGTIAAGNTDPTPGFAAEVSAPQALPPAPVQVTQVPDEERRAAPVVPPEPAQPPARVTVRTVGTQESGFEPSGLATHTKRLLNNSFITIEEPQAGQTGRKTIRILPSDLGKGSFYRRTGAQDLVRVAQIQTANDATTGLPDVDNQPLRITGTGVPVFQGAPTVAPPRRKQAQAPVGDDGLRAFSDGIAQVLDQPGTAPRDLSGLVVQAPTLSTPRPRPNPRLTQSATAAPEPQSTVPVQPAAAGQLRPQPRPASLVRRLQQRDIEAAAEQAASEAIRENMPTVNAVFVSLWPKPRPNRLDKSVTRSVPGLTSGQSNSKSVVRAAPESGASSTGSMTTSDTPKSVAALATESARLDRHSLSLIGIFGTNSSRRALLRMKNGRYIKVKPGDEVSGWNVSAIGEDSVRIKRGSKDQVLRMPQ